jgi:hypothetical protein
MKKHPPKIFKKLVNKNAIPKTRNRETPLAIFPESLDPPREFGKNFKYPPWIFNPCASMTPTHIT